MSAGVPPERGAVPEGIVFAVPEAAPGAASAVGDASSPGAPAPDGARPGNHAKRMPEMPMWLCSRII